MGPVRRGLHAQPAAANHGGRAHRQQRRHPDAHHVRRHEPRHRLGAAGRLRHGEHRPGGGHGLRRRGQVHRRGRHRGGAQGGKGGDHRAGLRSRRRGRPVRRGRHHQDAQGSGVQRALRHPPGGGAHAGAAQRVAGRGGRAVRCRARDGGDQRRLPQDGHHARRRRERHHQQRGRGGPQLDHRGYAGAAGVELQAGRRDEALHGRGLRWRRQPRLLQGQHRHAVGRRQGHAGGHQSRARQVK
mmetsp:Transcript_14635/g.34537  ORF Transcript_14635/g.34537 Transcript_14635/m.34537 type:complete len:242 (+) Transcript_14635:1458-2183(+)